MTRALIKINHYAKIKSIKDFAVGDDLLTATEVKSIINDLSSLFESYGIFENISHADHSSFSRMKAERKIV